jgi:hypothetical protein
LCTGRARPPAPSYCWNCVAPLPRLHADGSAQHSGPVTPATVSFVALGIRSRTCRSPNCAASSYH